MDTVNRAQEWGIKASGDPDWSAVRAFEDKIVDKLVKGVTGLIKTRGITVMKGTAKLLPGPALEVEGQRIDATDVVIATGSTPRLLPGVEVTDRIITSDEALRYDRIPELRGRDRSGRRGTGVRVPLPVAGRGGHAPGGPARPRAARGRGRLGGDRQGVPAPWHQGVVRRIREGDRRHGRGRRRDVRSRREGREGHRRRLPRGDRSRTGDRGPRARGRRGRSAREGLRERGRSAADERRARLGRR